MNDRNPFARLIESRLADLQLTKAQLIARLGYRNIAKGLSRLDQVCRGEFNKADFLLSGLARGLDLEPSQIEEARLATLQERRQRAEEEEARSFRPYAIFLTEHRVPTQIVIAGLIGADRQRYVYFDDDAAPETFKDAVLAAMPSAIPAFGRVLGFIINYRIDHAVEYDTGGSIVAAFDRRRSVGHIKLSL